MILFHTGFGQIREPDIHHGRKNADFGQGFYLSSNEAFSKRWATERSGCSTILNRYELDTGALKIRCLSRDMEWFRYLIANRAARPDAFSAYDVIAGPIANDTIYDTFGILTSGLVDEESALEILRIGPEYEQIVLKTEKAVSALRFLSCEELSHEQIAAFRSSVRKEEESFQKECARLLMQSR